LPPQPSPALLVVCNGTSAFISLAPKRFRTSDLKFYTWASSNSSFATVTNAGVVTGAATGTLA